MKRFLSLGLMLLTLTSSLAVEASAADFSFSTDHTPEYYGSTSYEDVFGSQYSYDHANVVDYQIPELPYGAPSTTQVGIMEKVMLPDLQQVVGGTVDMSGGGYGIGGSSVVLPEYRPDAGHGELLPDAIAFTKYSKDFCLSNGAVGRLSIPSLGIRNYYVWEGETTSSMRKGVGHFSSTSVWDGNVGICGHNRGAKYAIGNIKNLDAGDKITYTTTEGTRTYLVETVAMIRNDDWSYLSGTADNRITLVTCVAGDSSHRYCVQAVEAD